MCLQCKACSCGNLPWGVQLHAFLPLAVIIAPLKQVLCGLLAFVSGLCKTSNRVSPAILAICTPVVEMKYDWHRKASQRIERV